MNSRSEEAVEIDGRKFFFYGEMKPGKFLTAREGLNKRDDRSVFFRYAEVHGRDYRERCGITGKPLIPEDGVYLVISNPCPPNRCVSKTLVDEIGFEAAARRLDENYKQAMAALRTHGHWF